MKEIRLGSGEVVKVVFEPCDTLEQVASRMKCDVYELIEAINRANKESRERQK